jgi:hypothetical protein
VPTTRIHPSSASPTTAARRQRARAPGRMARQCHATVQARPARDEPLVNPIASGEAKPRPLTRGLSRRRWGVGEYPTRPRFQPLWEARLQATLTRREPASRTCRGATSPALACGRAMARRSWRSSRHSPVLTNSLLETRRSSRRARRARARDCRLRPPSAMCIIGRCCRHPVKRLWRRWMPSAPPCVSPVSLRHPGMHRQSRSRRGPTGRLTGISRTIDWPA